MWITTPSKTDMDSILRPGKFGKSVLSHITWTDILTHANIQVNFQERNNDFFLVNQNIPLHSSMEDEEYPLSEKFLLC